MNNLLLLDQSITLFLNSIIPHNITLNYFFSFFSLKGNSIFVWIIVIIISVLLEERKNPGISNRDKKFIILFSISFLLTFLLTDIVLKNIFLRPRPTFTKASAGKPFLTNFNQLQLIQPTSTCPKDFSFPSGHAATAFAAAAILTYFDKKRRWFYYIVALLISYSRIYLGCHYFLDVIIGAQIGWLISNVILNLFQDPEPSSG